MEGGSSGPTLRIRGKETKLDDSGVTVSEDVGDVAWTDDIGDLGSRSEGGKRPLYKGACTAALSRSSSLLESWRRSKSSTNLPAVSALWNWRDIHVHFSSSAVAFVDLVVGLMVHRFQCSNVFADSLERLKGPVLEERSTRELSSENFKSVTIYFHQRCMYLFSGENLPSAFIILYRLPSCIKTASTGGGDSDESRSSLPPVV